ncbi:hypothetical protein AB0M02_14245 [Actinoplanes sp. NPDC051861]|uniref:hypothetical protein n=1 Tax=Actinoplanes sp. NPDC051861 TaxID=3155170 RepID=UPI003426F3A6
MIEDRVRMLGWLLAVVVAPLLFLRAGYIVLDDAGLGWWRGDRVTATVMRGSGDLWQVSYNLDGDLREVWTTDLTGPVAVGRQIEVELHPEYPDYAGSPEPRDPNELPGTLTWAGVSVAVAAAIRWYFRGRERPVERRPLPRPSTRARRSRRRR